jgi:hypothetical protein
MISDLEPPKVLQVSINVLFVLSVELIILPIIIGNTNNVCAKIIAIGVNNIPQDPSGPLLAINKTTNSPITTGGTAIIVNINFLIAFLNLKSVTLIKIAKGVPITLAIKVADIDTIIDKRITL